MQSLDIVHNNTVWPMIAIVKDMAYLQYFYHTKTAEDKTAVVNKYAQEHLVMTADVDINDDKQRKPEYQNSPLGKRFCKSPNQDEDVQQLAEDCMCHQCNKYYLRSAKTNMNGPRTCRVHFGKEKNTENKTHKGFHVQKGPKYLSTGKAFQILE
jgi:hypothetical protein